MDSKLGTSTFVELGKVMAAVDPQILKQIFHQANIKNQWFTHDNMQQAWQSYIDMFKNDMETWMAKYDFVDADSKKNLNIGIIMAGNIPMVGLHDLICVLATGHKALVKLSSNDEVLIPFIIELLKNISPELYNNVSFIEKLENYEAVIATGSNNTAQHFASYFKNVPHIIRRNRNGVAIIYGDETVEEIAKLGHDIFDYFGMGCRNVSKLYLPEGYDIKYFYEPLEQYNDIVNHNKYANNYTYQRAIHLMNLSHIYDNNFLILFQNTQISSPIATCHYEYYNDLQTLEAELLEKQNEIQCIISTKPLPNLSSFKPGEAQYPTAWDYADGVDTIQWLLDL
ncbi:MAG: acyl-CoA reductase [Bacteroidota bacterium]|nr:acyl-CoA reductase [Bacteroidota bacterium]